MPDFVSLGPIGLDHSRRTSQMLLACLRGLLRLPGLPFAGHRQAAGPGPGLLGRDPGVDGRGTGDGPPEPGGSEADPRLPDHPLRKGFVEAPP